MKKFLLIALLFILNSCATNYYYVNIDEDTTIYSSKEGTQSVALIPKGSGAYINRSDKKQRQIKWGDYKGWVINPVYNNSSLSSSSNRPDSSTQNYNRSSTTTSSGGSVSVKGYTRKDGTYVRSHTRSAARRR
ncbi:hypothetical protein ACHRV5_20685 [Flavobacterium sp. FlaQc-52]|jgi:hypothetical protein|uniref:hypothetical protein n=1 Tax=Flavobacterium sp. FlaQc-52 TaxID=3374185 RepID=UPI003757FFF5